MAVSQMQRVQIYTHSSHQASLINDLQDLEIIHINNINDQSESASEVPEVPAESELKDIIRSMQNDLSRLQTTITYLADFKEKKGLLGGLMGGRITLSSQEYSDIVNKADQSQWRNICDECQALAEQTTRLSSRENRLYADKENLLQWYNLDAPVEALRDTDKTIIRIGSIPISVYGEFLSDASSSEADIAVETVKQTRNEVNLVVIFLKENEQKASALLSRYGFSVASLPLTSGTVSDQLVLIDEELLEISKQREVIAEKSSQLAIHRPDLMTIYDHLKEALRREEIRESFINTEHTFMVDGWVRKRDVKELEDKLSEKYDELAIVVSDPLESDEPPVVLENRSLASPFQMITRLYGLPPYRKTDPSPLLAPFFALSLGICLSDVGYGILVILIAYFISRKLKSYRDLFNIMIISGSMGIVMGAITGGWFGISSEKLPSFLLSIRLIDPIKNQMPFMGLVIAIGFIQVWFGYFVKMRLYIKDRDWVGAFLEQLPWMLVMILIPVAVLLSMIEATSVFKASLAVIVLCLLILVAFAGRANKNPAARIAAGLFELYGKVSGTLGDILSYMRLFALGLSSGILAGVMNTIAGIMWGNPVGKVLAFGLLVGGHIFNLLMSCLGGFIHTTRLQFVEFFTKFYESGGEEFRPFRKEYNYITVVDQDNPQNQTIAK